VSIGDDVEALIVQVDTRERRIGLSIKALSQHMEREEMQAYLKREHEAQRFSMEDILKGEELRLDRDDAGRAAPYVWPAEVFIECAGRSHTLRTRPHKGAPSNPFSWAEVCEKFQRYTASVVKVSQARALIDLVGRLEQVTDMADVAALAGRDFVPAPGTDFAALREARLDLLGDLVANHLDTGAVLGLISDGAPSGLPVIPPAGGSLAGGGPAGDGPAGNGPQS